MRFAVNHLLGHRVDHHRLCRPSPRCNAGDLCRHLDHPSAHLVPIYRTMELVEADRAGWRYRRWKCIPPFPACRSLEPAKTRVTTRREDSLEYHVIVQSEHVEIWKSL